MCFTVLGPAIPLLEVSKRFSSIHKDITVFFTIFWFRYGDLLQSAVGSGNRIRLDCMGDILMNTAIPMPQVTSSMKAAGCSLFTDGSIIF